MFQMSEFDGYSNTHNNSEKIPEVQDEQEVMIQHEQYNFI